VCCSVLQCVAVCCAGDSDLRVWCVLQCVAVCYRVLQYIVLQSVALMTLLCAFGFCVRKRVGGGRERTLAKENK